jgi:hypothetical protein
MSSTVQRPSRQNHYVPEWYQRGFILEGGQHWLLDLSPPRRRPDGIPISSKPNRRAPKSAFWERDLYVTRFGEQFNDEVETVLFQGIDDFGALAVRAFLGGDARQVHEQYRALLNYMGAQKLRTPKGLDWIRSRYPALSQVDLLVEMQHLRHMFGALWAEAVHEVVSAEDSEVKFLVTDHPVATFNAVLPGDAGIQTYPNDAPITWNGTQTLFPLDSNQLLVLTHVGYAKDPSVVDLAAKRTNARYFGNAMMRTNRLIRGRRFSREDVIAVNAWLKRRARRYIAAGEPEWLYPEREQLLDHTRLAELLRPPKKELWHYGGETYMGFNDGTYGYRDAYGRTSREHEFVAKAPPASPPPTEEACPCGNGQPYGKCCEPLAPWERPPWDVLSLRERNLGFLRAIVGVLNLDDEDAWSRVQRTLSDEQVAQLHRISQGLWPKNTDLAALLPRPGDGLVRAVYLGPSDPRTSGESFISLVPLFDQILVMDPFLAARNLRPEFSPVTSPAQHKLQFLKNVWFWLLLQPLIVAGKVLVFPDPGDLNPDFQRAMHEMAKARTATWEPASGDLVKFENLAREDFQRSLLLLPDDTLFPLFKKSAPDKSDAFVQKVIDYMRREAENDPMALLQILGTGERLSQALVVRSVNLEVAIFIAQSTGAVPVTDVTSLWNHLHDHTRATQGGVSAPTNLDALRMLAVLNPFDGLSIAESSAAADARVALRTVFEATQSRSEDMAPSFEALGECLDTLRRDVVSPHGSGPKVVLQLTPSTPTAGFESPTVQRLVVGFGRAEPPILVGLALFRATEGDESSNFRS